jgi:hypothetical protein
VIILISGLPPQVKVFEMSELVELSNVKHADFHVTKNCQLDFAASQHLLNIRLIEVGQTVCSLPVFLTKDAHHGLWRLSAISSFNLGHNLLVQNNQWLAPYQPTCIQTYPFHLMKSPKDEQSYTIGIEDQNKGFSKSDGNALFEPTGKASLFLGRIKSLLETDIGNDVNTYQFGKLINELRLCKPINLLIRYQDDSTQKITGLSTVDEDKLRNLSPSQLETLNQKGYLTAIHGMLISILQINALIQKNNALTHLPNIKNIKIEVSQ